jgi:hypothetical protein
MFKHLSILIFISFFFIELGNAQNIRFKRSYNLTQSQYQFCINSGIFDVLIQDTFTYFSGVCSNNTPMGYHIPMIGCLNLHGDTIWTKREYTNLLSRQTRAGALLQISKNKFIQVGMVWDTQTYNGIKILHYPFLHQFDNNGNTLFTKICNDSIDRAVFGSTYSGGYIYLAGVLFSDSLKVVPGGICPDTASFFLEKYDTLGNKIWLKKYFSKRYSGGAPYYDVKNMIPLSDGGVLISCYSGVGDPDTNNLSKPAFLKFDKNGNFQWIKKYQNKNYRNSIYNNWVCNGENDSVFYFASNCSTVYTPSSLPYTNSLLYYGKLNANGDTLWTKHYADTGSEYGFKHTEGRFIKYFNGKLYMLTFEYLGWPEMGLFVSDTLGKILSYRNLKVLNYHNVVHEAFSLDICNNRIVIGGTWINYGKIPEFLDTSNNLNYSWVIQADTFACWDENCQMADSIWTLSINKEITLNQNKLSSLLVYPNPTSGMLQVDNFKEGTLYVYNALGQLIIQQSKSLIDLSKHANGIYHIRAYNQAQELIGIGRVVKE